jgi:FAD dependent oxidoreductase TIGR03364
MQLKDKFDLIIIGGGILGAFSALHALQKGKKVALIERNKYPKEATIRNFGQIVPSGLSTTWKKYGLKSLQIYKELQAIRDFSVRHFGSAYIASDDDEVTLLHEVTQIHQNLEFPSSFISEKEACSRWPGLKSSYCREVLFYPDELSVDPAQMIRLVIQYLIEQYELSYFPYTIAQDVEVIDANTCKVYTNTNLNLSGEQVLICAGTEYQFLFPTHYKNEEISCVKIHMLMTEPQPTQRIWGNLLTGLSIRRYEAFKECPSYEIIKNKNVQDPRVASWGIHLLFKQADNGQVIIGDSHHYADAHDKEDLGFRLDQPVIEYILERAAEIMDLESYKLQSSWSGIYSQAKKEDIIARSIDNKIHILNAIGGKGMTASPGFTFEYINKLFAHD